MCSYCNASTSEISFKLMYTPLFLILCAEKKNDFIVDITMPIKQKCNPKLMTFSLLKHSVS